jgi:lysine/ornithine N-monooxygenase
MSIYTFLDIYKLPDKPVNIFKRLVPEQNQNNEEYNNIMKILQTSKKEDNKTKLYDFNAIYNKNFYNIMEYIHMHNILNRRDLTLNEIARFATLKAIYDNTYQIEYHDPNTLQRIEEYDELLTKLKNKDSIIIPNDFIL